MAAGDVPIVAPSAIAGMMNTMAGIAAKVPPQIPPKAHKG